MIKLPLKHMALGLALFSAVYLAGISTAFAQSHVDHKMNSIHKAIEVGRLDIPNDVLRQIEDILNKTADIKKVQDAKLHLEMKGVIENFISDADMAERLQLYYASEPYRNLIQQNNDRYNELYQEALSVLEPYIGKPETFKLRSRIPKITGQTLEDKVDDWIGKIKRMYEGYGFPLSDYDVTALKSIIRERILFSEKTHALYRSRKKDRNSPEFKQRITQSREIRDRMDLILEPYENKHKARQGAKRAVLQTIVPPVTHIRPTKKEKRESAIESTIEDYASEGITISDVDKKEINRLMVELENLKDEVTKLRLTRRVNPNSIEAVNLKTRYEEISQRLENIVKPYEKQRANASKKK